MSVQPVYSFDEVFPAVSVSFLKSLLESHGSDVEKVRDSCFRQRQIVNPLVREKAISITLNAPLRHRKLGEDVAAQEVWNHKYRDQLLLNLQEFPDLLDPTEWKVMLFTHPESLDRLDPDLLDTIRQLDYAELHFMANASELLSPATLWRFLPLSDLTLEQLLILDIDEDWKANIDGWYRGSVTCNMPFTRAHHIPRQGFWLNLLNPWTIYDGSINNYLPIMASKILARPRELGLKDMATIMAAYIVLRQQRVYSGFPSTQLSDNEPITPYNRPYNYAPYGFGNHWNDYCFDERFLAHVVYHHVVARGALCTYCYEQYLVPDLFEYLNKYNLVDFMSDYAYVRLQSSNNIIVNRGRSVDFPALPVFTRHGEGLDMEYADAAARQTGCVPLPTSKRGILPDVEFHPSGDVFAVTSWAENEVYIYSARCSPPRLQQRIKGCEAGFETAHSIVFSPSGDKMLVNAYLNNTILVFNVSLADCLVDTKPIRIFSTPAELLTSTPHSMDLTSDGRFLVCAYCDGEEGFNKVAMYRLELSEPGHEFTCIDVLDAKSIEFKNSKGVSFTPCDRGIVVTLADSNNLVLHDFDPESGRIDPEPRQVLRNPDSDIHHPEDVCFTRCGRYCLVANASSNDVGIYRYDLQERRIMDIKPVFRLGGPEVTLNYPHGIDVSPDNRLLLVTDYGYYPEGEREESPLNQPAKVMMFEFNPEIRDTDRYRGRRKG
ncbi:hypothetical protein ACFL1S_02450 [Pseudomonadota bacterium]